MLFFALLLAGLVIGWTVLPLRIHWRWKVVLGVLVLATALKFQILHLLGGPMFFAPDLPGDVLLVAGWLYAILFFYFFLLLAKTVSAGIVWLYRLCRNRKIPAYFGRIDNLINLWLLFFAAFLATAGVWFGMADPEVREETVALAQLPAGAEGLRIAVLADIHVDKLTRAEHVRAMVETVDGLRPDLIVIAGDFVDGTVEACGPELQALKGLKARYGVFGIPGNHEYFSGYGEWMRFLPSLDIRMLVNESVQLPCGLVLAGVADPVAAREGEEAPDVKKALANTGAGAVTVLLSHQPKLAPEAAAAGVDLQISGHTHGGMVRGLDYAVARFNGGYVSGWYDVGDMKLYVSNGSGIWNGFPVRLGRPSEITLLTLTRR